MFRKIIIRFSFIMLTMSGIMLAVAAKSDRDYNLCKASETTHDDKEDENTGRKEFIIWESFSRSLMSSVKF